MPDLHQPTECYICSIYSLPVPSVEFLYMLALMECQLDGFETIKKSLCPEHRKRLDFMIENGKNVPKLMGIYGKIQDFKNKNAGELPTMDDVNEIVKDINKKAN